MKVRRSNLFKRKEAEVQEEDLPVLLSEFARRLLGAASVDLPLAALRDEIAKLDASTCEETVRRSKSLGGHHRLIFCQAFRTRLVCGCIEASKYLSFFDEICPSLFCW